MTDMFLLKHVGDVELRKLIHAGTNKSEPLNGFAKIGNWVSPVSVHPEHPCFDLGGRAAPAPHEPEKRRSP